MNEQVIRLDSVVSWEINHAIIYWDGAHSKDLRKKWLLPEGTPENTAHHVVLPIVTIESAVLELLEQWIPQADIISYAGVMAKAPNGIPSVHALWGPVAKTKLKIAVAMETFSRWNVLMQKLLETMTSHDVRIIETNKIEHDSKMAVVQGLIHLWIVMVGKVENEKLKRDVIANWKTPIGTIIDMIHANPFAEILIKRFFESLSWCDYDVSIALEQSINEHLSGRDILDFWTPNSDRVMKFISEEWWKVILSGDDISSLRSELNTNGHRALQWRIRDIRGA